MKYTGVLTGELNHFRQSVYHLRYEVLVKEQGKHPKYADHSLNLVQEPLDENGTLIVKIVDGKVVGSARMNRFSEITDPFLLECYNLEFFREHHLQDEIVIISRLMMLPAFRGTASFASFAKEIYSCVLRSGRSLILIECTAVYAVAFKRLGFLHYHGSFLHPDGMMVSPMVLDCNNREWLRKIGSILAEPYPKEFREKREVSKAVAGLVGEKQSV